MVRLDRHVVADLTDRHLSRPGEELSQCAGMPRVQMLHQHKSHAGIGRQMLQQVRAGLQASSRSTYADDRKSDCGLPN